MVKITRQAYADMYGPTVGDRVRLGDTELWIEVERDATVYGDEVKFGGGKVIRDGMGQSQRHDDSVMDTVITNALILDWWGVVKADVGLYDAEFGVENQRVGDDHVKRFGVPGQGRLAHAVADHLAAAELDLVAVAGALGDEVALDLDEQISVAQTHLVAGGRPINFRVLLSCESEWHVVLFLVMPATGR